jgi:hypothetical protein
MGHNETLCSSVDTTWMASRRAVVVIEVGQKLSLCDNDHSCLLGHHFPEDNLNKAHLLFCKEVGSA